MPQPSPSVSSVQHRAELLGELIERSDPASRKLPSFGPPEWWVSLKEWLSELLSPLVRFLDGILQAVLRFLFGERRDSLTELALTKEDLLIWLAGLMIGVATFWLGARVLRRFVRKGTSIVPGADELSVLLEVGLEARMRAALDTSDYPLATRLLWRIFLRRQGISPSLTPAEYMASGALRDVRPGGYEMDDEIVGAMYWLMFSGESSAEQFRVCERCLLGERHGQMV